MFIMVSRSGFSEIMIFNILFIISKVLLTMKDQKRLSHLSPLACDRECNHDDDRRDKNITNLHNYQ